MRPPGLRSEAFMAQPTYMAWMCGDSLRQPAHRPCPLRLVQQRLPGGPGLRGGAVHDRGGATPAALGRLWWGLRAPPEASSHYEIAVGLWAEARYFPGDGTVDALAGVSVDFYALALPVIYLASAFSPRRR
jgi:hypothetical protein